MQCLPRNKVEPLSLVIGLCQFDGKGHAHVSLEVAQELVNGLLRERMSFFGIVV